MSVKYARQRQLKAELLATRKELMQTSAQDQFAKWAKLRRSVDKGLAELEKLSESHSSRPAVADTLQHGVHATLVTFKLLTPPRQRARRDQNRLFCTVQQSRLDTDDGVAIRYRVVVQEVCRILPTTQLVWSSHVDPRASVCTSRSVTVGQCFR